MPIQSRSRISAASRGRGENGRAHMIAFCYFNVTIGTIFGTSWRNNCASTTFLHCQGLLQEVELKFPADGPILVGEGRRRDLIETAQRHLSVSHRRTAPRIDIPQYRLLHRLHLRNTVPADPVRALVDTLGLVRLALLQYSVRFVSP